MSQPTQLVNLAHAQCVELFHDALKRGYATVTISGRAETWRIKGEGFENYLRVRFHKSYGKVPEDRAVRAAVAQLDAEAKMADAEHRVWLRFAEHDGAVYLDLANAAREVVAITADGWLIVQNPPVKFLRPPGMLTQVTPVAGGRVDELRLFVNVANDRDFRLIIAFMLAAMRPIGPKLGLAVSGEQGSGKDCTFEAIRRLVDPNGTKPRGLPPNPRTLMIAAQNSWLLCFGNLSHLPKWVADALSAIMTGAGHAERELFKDEEEVLFQVLRPVMFNGIPDLTEAGDLKDRMPALQLPSIPPDQRRDEEGDLWPAFEAARPRILGALCDAVVCALRELPMVKLAKLPRMADAAKWVTAAEKSLGWSPGTFLTDFEAMHAEASTVVLEASSLWMPLVTFLVQVGEPVDADMLEWHGTATELLKVLRDIARAAGNMHGLPTAPNAFTNGLRRLAPALRAHDIDVAFSRATTADRTRLVTLTWRKATVLAASGVAS